MNLCIIDWRANLYIYAAIRNRIWDEIIARRVEEKRGTNSV